MWLEEVKKFWLNNQKLIKIVLTVVLSLAFIGSVIGTVFSGDEFKPEEVDVGVKGLLRVNDAEYSTNYLKGDKFKFDKESAEVLLLAKDPAIEDLIRIDRLPASEYGFKVNGVGKTVFDPSEIIMDKDVKSVDVVSRVYPDLKMEIPVTVLGSIDETKLVNEITLEAEETDLYMDGVLLTEKDKETKPAADKPFRSDKGTDIQGAKCSGGACLRNFQTNNMKIEFSFVCLEETEVELELMFCLRKESKKFGDYFLFKLNGKEVPEVSGYTVPKGNDFYTPHTAPKVTIKLNRGLNVITLESGNKVGKINPVNFDAVRIVAAEGANILGGLNVVKNEAAGEDNNGEEING